MMRRAKKSSPAASSSYPTVSGFIRRQQRRVGLGALAVVTAVATTGCPGITMAGDLAYPSETGMYWVDGQVDLAIPQEGSRTVYLYTGDEWVDYHLELRMASEQSASDVVAAVADVIALADETLREEAMRVLLDGASLHQLQEALGQNMMDMLGIPEHQLLEIRVVIDAHGREEAIPGDMG